MKEKGFKGFHLFPVRKKNRGDERSEEDGTFYIFRRGTETTVSVLIVKTKEGYNFLPLLLEKF